MIDKDKEDNEMPEATESVIPEPSQLEIEATEVVIPEPLVQEDTTTFTEEDKEKLSKRYERDKKRFSNRILIEKNKEHKRDMGFAEALEGELNGEPSREYTDKHVYVWWKKSTNGSWNLHHTKPENLKDRLQRGGATIEDKDVIYGGKKFKKYSEFEYVYSCGDDSAIKGGRKGNTMRINKYSLTPKGAEEIINRVLCEEKMRRGSLTQRTPSRF